MEISDKELKSRRNLPIVPQAGQIVDENEANRLEEEAEKRIFEKQEKEKNIAEKLAIAREKRPFKEVSFCSKHLKLSLMWLYFVYF